MSYILTNKQGKYLARGPDNKFYATSDINKALAYTDPVKMTNILNSTLPKIYRKDNFYLSQIKDVEDEGISSSSKLIELNIKEIEDKFQSLKKDIDDIISNKKILQAQLSLCDKEIVDFEHFIEFNSFSASAGYKLSKMMQSVLKARRQIKNYLKVIEILQTQCENISSQRTQRSLENVEHQSYAPRVLNEMFTKGVDAEWSTKNCSSYYSSEKIKS